MKRPERLREDDGRVVADMEPLSGPDERLRESAHPDIPPMTRAQTRRFILSATLAGLTVAAVLSLAAVGLVLFCQLVWLR